MNVCRLCGVDVDVNKRNKRSLSTNDRCHSVLFDIAVHCCEGTGRWNGQSIDTRIRGKHPKRQYAALERQFVVSPNHLRTLTSESGAHTVRSSEKDLYKIITELVKAKVFNTVITNHLAT